MGYSKFKISLLLFVLLFGVAGSGYSQTLGEFFNQKKKQKQYLLQQIAALQVYIGYAKKGYDIVGSGLETVRDFTNGEFKLHDAFISSLKQVSPVVLGNAKIAQIIELQLSTRKAFGNIAQSDLLSSFNSLYIGQVKAKVISECDGDLEEMLLIITSGKLEMGDQQRLERLEKVYSSMKEKAAFVQDFVGNVNLLIRQKKNEQKQIDLLKKSYEIN
ncbi:hypothetical protein WG904_17625 [Pedobacter sp. Du54]|uniref:hypothetical protein n=1 Tax=Pedobacter anseongensis TaxID=3133439 RepID=UPI0030AD8514